MTGPDESPAVGPAYGGTADSGVVQSVGEHHPSAGDVVDALTARHRTLQGVLEEVRSLVDSGDAEALRLRWGGVARALLEQEVAEERVAYPAAERVAGVGAVEEIRRRSEQVVGVLRRHDAYTPDDVEPQDVEPVLALVAEHLRTVDAVVVPLLGQLPATERMRLGEDLRQVLG